jgi:hypothetical protein
MISNAMIWVRGAVAAVVSATALFTSHGAVAADHIVIDLRSGLKEIISESDKDYVSFLFRITNNGESVRFTSIVADLAPFKGYDTTNDSLMPLGSTQGDEDSCGNSLDAGKACNIRFRFKPVDNDKLDAHEPPVVDGKWGFFVRADWTTAEGETGFATSMPGSCCVIVVQDDTPEPAAWLLMLLGAALVGARVRAARAAQPFRDGWG